MHIFIYRCTHVCMYICMYAYTYACIYMGKNACTCIFVFVTVAYNDHVRKLYKMQCSPKSNKLSTEQKIYLTG